MGTIIGRDHFFVKGVLFLLYGILATCLACTALFLQIITGTAVSYIEKRTGETL